MLPAQAVEPVVVSAGVIVKEAWARLNAAGATEVLLVVNNRGKGDAILGIQVPEATDAQEIGAAGPTFELTIPIHSELYIDSGGVRVVATGLPASSLVPVLITVGIGDPVVIQADFLADP